ncbi:MULTISPECIES: N-acetylmuramoyl-L-alanine amidase [unclassified Actinotalea]|uniref:N-acetylmuramoyl-L-alanine amidase n=1 Tax=unclassified Actinotalea TaxID=2638618 RepID=UPI0015F59A95|nr:MULTISPECIES: N-acetylmuramoyl-L-alanine amidase [unclassified Actinotalea]
MTLLRPAAVALVTAAVTVLASTVSPAPAGAVTTTTATTTAATTTTTATTTATPAARGVPTTEDPAAAGEDGTFTEVEVVVPPVDEDGEVALTPEVAAGQADPSVVVADEVVADRVEGEVLETETFQTLGVTWPAEEEVADLGLEVRTRAAGSWSEWVPLEPADDGPDPGSPDAANALRNGTDPLWVGDADAVQLSFRATPEGGPQDMALALIGSPEAASDDEGAMTVETAAWTPVEAAADVPAAGPVLTATQPRVISRAEWGARAQVCSPDTASQLVGVVVHHTAGSNAYSSVDQAKQQIRNDQRYHIESRGWCDIGYNFIVDKWGNIYEGRANSLTQPVIGVHAGGFNTGTVGISMLGDYSQVNPGAAVQESIAQLAAWRLRQYHRDPNGTMSFRTLGGENSKYPAGATVTLPVVFAHRDVGNTACPGNAGYATLPNIRTRAAQLAAPSLVNPSVPASVRQGSAVTLAARTLGDINWRLEARDARTGVLVHASIGYGQQAFGGVVATWDGNNSAGRPVGPGPYRLTLSGTGAGGAAIHPYSATVTVTGSQNPATVAPVPLTGDLRFVPVTPTRVLDTRPLAESLGPDSRRDVVVAGVGGVPADAKAVAVNITAVNSSTITHLRAWPAGQSRPGASVLNADAARSASASGVTLGVGGEGKISLYNSAGSTHVLVDVTGYYTTSGGSGYAQLGTAARVLDTRTTGGRMSDGQRRSVTVAGQGGIPADATAVVMNVTSVVSGGNGYVSVVPAGAAAGQTSSVNHLPGTDVANRTTVPLNGGKVDVLLAGAPANVVLDVVGWFGPGATGRFTPIAPVRAFDTRAGGGPIGAGQSRTFPMSSVAGLPATARAAAITLTTTQQTSPVTYLTVWPAGAGRPPTSDLNTGRGRDQANNAVVGLSPAGVQVYNNLGQTHVLADVYGFYR